MGCTGPRPPAAVPFGAELQVDLPALLHHCRALLAEGASGLAALGATSGANGPTLTERQPVLDDPPEGGIPADRLMPGAYAIGGAVDMSRRAIAAGCAGVLLLPPLFYKGVADNVLHDHVERVIGGVADDRLRIFLYHNPQMAGFGWSLALIDRLITEFPDTVVGLKDSAGDWDKTRSVIVAFPGFAVFPANEAHLDDAPPLGAAGCISAAAKVNAGGIAELTDARRSVRDAGLLRAEVTRRRIAVTSGPLSSGNKALLAQKFDAPGRARVRSPLTRMSRDTSRLPGDRPALKAPAT